MWLDSLQIIQAAVSADWTQVSFAIPYHFVESSEINDVET